MTKEPIKKAVLTQRRWEAADKDARDKFIVAALTTYEGRKFLTWLLQIGKVGAQPFATNALVTSFNCGELNIGNQILASLLETDPAGYVRMMQENDDERRKRDTILGAYAGDDARGAGSDESGLDYPFDDLRNAED